MHSTEYNPFINRLNQMDSLTGESTSMIQRILSQKRKLKRYEHLVHPNDRVSSAYVVEFGLLYAYNDLPDGRRQITRVIYPGDFVGLSDLTEGQATSGVVACTNSTVSVFSQTVLDEIFSSLPSLAYSFFKIVNKDTTSMSNSLLVLGRMNARERLAFFMLESIKRVREFTGVNTASIRLPMSQREIGDFLGLTHTYVSKTLCEMETQGYITRKGDVLTLKREQCLRDMLTTKSQEE